MSTWSVIATVRAPLRQCELFYEHYLAIGATRVFLYHDDPQMGWDIKHDSLTNTICNDWWWRHGRFEGLEQRQQHNATKAKNWSRTEWVIHCDIDELLWSEERISDILARQPDDVAGLIIRPAEAIYAKEPTIETIYQTPYFKSLGDGVKPYEDMAKVLYGDMTIASKAGFWGHTNGKSLLKKVPSLRGMPLHHKQDTVPGLSLRKPCPEILLRHYDGTTYEEWKAKHMRRISGEVMVPRAGRHRQQQENHIRRAWEEKGEEGLREVYLRMTTVSAENLKMGLDTGFIREIIPESHLRHPTQAGGADSS